MRNKFFNSLAQAAFAGALMIAAQPVAGAAPAAQAATERLALMGVAPTPERLVQFAAQGDITMVELLLRSGVAIDSVESAHRTTALHNAAAQGHARLVTLLIARGAQVDAVDWHGNTALIDAAYFGHLDTVKILLKSGANINTVSNEGQSALSAATFLRKPALMAYLREQGAGSTLAVVSPTGGVEAAGPGKGKSQ